MRITHLLVLLATLMCGNNAFAADKPPLKVFILAGQSNMQGHAHVRTFDHLGMDPKTAPLLKLMRDENGKPTVCKDVWISSIGSSDSEQTGRLTAGFGANVRGPKIGPEFTFGIYMHKHLNEPILMIKTAWGGKSLNTDFRPPSAGPFEFSQTQLDQFKSRDKDIEKIQADKAKATGHYYRQMIDHVKKVLADIKRVYPDYDPQQSYELSGLVWFQGWNDMVDRGVYPNRDQPGGYDQYSQVLNHFIRDVRRDLGSPALPIVIGVMGVGGPVNKYLPDQKRYATVHQNFRDAMAAPAAVPEFKGNVATVLTENFWDLEVTKLRARDAKVKQKVKQLVANDKLNRKDASAMQQKLRDEEFTAGELKTLENAVSNAEYHYLGSAKILGQIGKGFADAMIALQQAGQN